MKFQPNKKKFRKIPKRYILTEKDLKVLFDGFNKSFFHERLNPGIKIRYVESSELAVASKHFAPDAAWRPQLNEIWIDKVYARSESVSCIMLLHEMAHAALEPTYIGHPSKNPGHGMIYQAEIFRLIMAGAYDGML